MRRLPGAELVVLVPSRRGHPGAREQKGQPAHEARPAHHQDRPIPVPVLAAGCNLIVDDTPRREPRGFLRVLRAWRGEGGGGGR